MTALVPIVLVDVDEDSRMRILSTPGVRVAFLDRRVDGDHLTILPAADQWPAILASVADVNLLSLRTDDPAQTAANTLARIASGQIVIAELK